MPAFESVGLERMGIGDWTQCMELCRAQGSCSGNSTALFASTVWVS